MKISVLIPTKNEPLINELVDEVHQVLKKFEHEIIVIDKSDIKPKINNAKIVVQKSEGLGKAVIEGLSYATGDVIVTMDGDFSHDPNDLPKLIEKTKEYDIVIGSRFVSGGITEDETHRKFISKVFRDLASFILKINIEDPMSGFAAIKRNVYETLQLNPIGYKINMEILYKGKKLGFKATEVPIFFHKRKAGKSKAKLKEALRTLIFILKLKIGIQ
jgi:dolichol-phosphate mannosyltransferase